MHPDLPSLPPPPAPPACCAHASHAHTPKHPLSSLGLQAQHSPPFCVSKLFVFTTHLRLFSGTQLGTQTQTEGQMCPLRCALFIPVASNEQCDTHSPVVTSTPVAWGQGGYTAPNLDTGDTGKGLRGPGNELWASCRRRAEGTACTNP